MACPSLLCCSEFAWAKTLQVRIASAIEEPPPAAFATARSCRSRSFQVRAREPGIPATIFCLSIRPGRAKRGAEIRVTARPAWPSSFEPAQPSRCDHSIGSRSVVSVRSPARRTTVVGAAQTAGLACGKRRAISAATSGGDRHRFATLVVVGKIQALNAAEPPGFSVERFCGFVSRNGYGMSALPQVSFAI